VGLAAGGTSEILTSNSHVSTSLSPSLRLSLVITVHRPRTSHTSSHHHIIRQQTEPVQSPGQEHAYRGILDGRPSLHVGHHDDDDDDDDEDDEDERWCRAVQKAGHEDDADRGASGAV
jgi:hypothetical protein